MANKQLTAKVRLNTTQAEKSIDRLVNKINRIDNIVNRTNSNGLSRQLGAGDRAAQRLTANMEKLKRAEYEAWWTAQLLRQEWQQAHPVLSRLSNAWNKIDSQIRRVISGSPRLSSAYDKITNKIRGIPSKVREWWSNQQRVNNSISSSNGLLGSIGSKLKGIAATYLGIMGTKAMIGTSDILTSAQNRLNNLNGNNADLTQNQMDKMYASANKVRMAYTDMLSNASKSMTLAGDAFQGNMDNAIRFQEIMAETYTLGGASAEEMSSSMYQMIQALGSGTLAGDELRSVREGAPLAYKAIEKFAQGVYDTDESLKDLASQGKITSDMVVAAIMKAGDKIDQQFENTSMTFGQAWDRIKNSAIKAFEPVSNALNKMLNKAAENGAFEKIENAFFGISKALQITMELISRAISWIADNWNWLKYVVLGALMIIMFFIIKTAVITVINAMIMAWAWLQSYWPLLLIIATLMVLMYFVELFKQGVINACELITIAIMVVAVAFLIAGIIMGSIPMLIISLVLALLAVVFYFFEQVCYGAGWLAAVIINILVGILNFIIGALVWVCAVIYNLVVGVINAIIQLIWTAFVDPITGVIEWFVNAFTGGFNGILGAGANAIGQLVNLFLSGLKIITKALDAAAGTSFTAKISGWQDSVKSWGKNENAVDYTVKAPELPRVSAIDAFKKGVSTLSYVDANAWGSAAGKWGAGVKDSINSWGSKFQNNDSSDKTSLLDSIGKKLGLDFSGLGSGFPNANDPAFDTSGAYNQPSIDDLIGGLDDIADDTGSIKDSMDLTEEDLKYLRKLAESEWTKEYTSNNIKIEMTNNNNVSGDSDLDGIVTKLAEKLNEELNEVANGVYA